MNLDKLLDKINRWYEHFGIYAVIDIRGIDVGDCSVGSNEHKAKQLGAGILQNCR